MRDFEKLTQKLRTTSIDFFEHWNDLFLGFPKNSCKI